MQRTTLPGLSPVAAADLVRRNFTALRPDAVWLSDVTEYYATVRNLVKIVDLADVAPELQPPV